METRPADLLPGERMRWEGRPIRHSLFRPQDALLVPVSVLLFGVSVYEGVSAVVGMSGSTNLLSSIGLLWGFPVALFGLYLIVGRFVVRAIASRRTRYVLTDQRLLIIGGLSGTRTASTYLRTLRSPVIVERPDRSGSLAFGAFPGAWDGLNRDNGWRVWAIEPSATPVMWNIPEVRRVRDLVAEAQRPRGAQPW